MISDDTHIWMHASHLICLKNGVKLQGGLQSYRSVGFFIPSNPSWQMQLKAFRWSTQVAPLWQGSLRHSSTSISQLWPGNKWRIHFIRNKPLVNHQCRQQQQNEITELRYKELLPMSRTLSLGNSFLVD